MLCLCELIYFSLGKNTQHNWIFLFYFFLNIGLAWCNFQCCIVKVIFWENIAFHGIPFLGPSREACERDPALCAEEAWESLKWTGLSGAAVAVRCNVLLQCPPPCDHTAVCVGRNLKDNLLPVSLQEHFSLDQCSKPHPSGLKCFQGWGIITCSGQPVAVPH